MTNGNNHTMMMMTMMTMMDCVDTDDDDVNSNDMKSAFSFRNSGWSAARYE